MNITILGSGPCAAIPRKGCGCAACGHARKPRSKTKRTRSSILILKKRHNLLIDCGPDFLEQAAREKIKKIDAVILTHAHADAAGGLKKLGEWTKRAVPVYTEQANFKRIKNLQKLELKNIGLARVKRVGPFKVSAYRVKHGLTSGFPTLGFKIDNRFGYISDVGEIPKKNLKYFKNLDLLFLDCAMYFGKKMKGHLNPAQAVEYIKILNPQKAVFTQIGHGFPPYEKAKREIEKYWQANKEGVRSKVLVGHDGMKFKI